MGFGDNLKKWAASKATEMLTPDSQARPDAEASADTAESQAKNDLGEQLLRTAFPKVGEWADKQKASQAAREQAAEQRRRDEIAALPLATVQLSVTGHVTDKWWGDLHVAWHDVAPEEPDPDYPSTDPYATRPLVWIELFADDDEQPNVGGLLLARWSFQIPGYTGDGTYDLTAIANERDTAGAGLSYEDSVMEFANTDDSSFYFYPDAGRSTVTVSEAGQKLAVTIAMTGATGDLTATATISR